MATAESLICDKCGAYVPADRIVMRRYAESEAFQRLRAFTDERDGLPLPEPFACHLVFVSMREPDGACGPVREMNEAEAWIWRLEAETEVRQ